jgi:hypothetical protein
MPGAGVGNRARQVARDASAALLMGLALISGLPGLVQVPYWYLSYSEGFIRRALLGTLTMPFLVDRPIGEAMHIIIAICATADAILIGGLTLFFQASRMRLLAPVPIAFLASGALPWLGRDLGMLDVFIDLLSLAAFALLFRGHAVGIALCAIVPLTHEGGLFLLLPLLGGLFLLRPSSRRVVALGALAAGAATAALWFFATAEFAWPAGMPPWDPVGLAAFRHWQLGQHPVLAWPAIFPRDLLPVAGAAVIAAATTYRHGWRAGAIVLGGTLFTWSSILIAVDTARLLAWGPLTAVLLAGLAARAEPAAAAAVGGTGSAAIAQRTAAVLRR